MSMNTLSIRRANAQDWPAVAALLARNKLPRDGAEAHIDDFFVATLDGGIIGIAGTEMRGSVALLRSVSIDAAHQNGGLGSRLVRHVLADAAARGVQDIYLLTTGAADYFPRLGFAVARREDVPTALLASAEFQGACPCSAKLMHRRLGNAQAKPRIADAVNT